MNRAPPVSSNEQPAPTSVMQLPIDKNVVLFNTFQSVVASVYVFRLDFEELFMFRELLNENLLKLY
jgi:hypothetical protein